MLVSHLHKFIYTKTVKTGGTSVEGYFERFCMPPGVWQRSESRDEHVSAAGIVGFRGKGDPPPGCTWWNHMPATQIRDLLGEATWNAYFKFCVIRNPYDKAISAFYFFKRFRAPEESQSLPDPVLFERFLRKRQPHDRDKYMIDGRICVDDFVRYENLQFDLERICQRVGVPWEPGRLAHYKGGIRPDSVKPADLYTEETRKLVEERYRFELEHFGYGFPETASVAE